MQIIRIMTSYHQMLFSVIPRTFFFVGLGSQPDWVDKVDEIKLGKNVQMSFQNLLFETRSFHFDN